MAERNMEESFDFGIVDTSALGNAKAVSAFLDEKALPEDEKELEEIDEEEELLKKIQEKKKAKAATAKKAAEPPKKSAEELLFEEEEEEEEEKEEEKEEDKKEEEKEDAKEEGKEKEEENDYEVLARDLIKLGVFTQESEDDPVPRTGAEFLAKFQKEKESGAIQWIDSFLSRHGDDRRDLFEAIYINGVDPKDYLPAYVQVENLKGLDISKESNQELVFREFYKRIKFPADKIEKKLQTAKDNGDLEEEAKDYHAQIITQDEEALAAQEASKAEKIAADQKADVEYKNNIGKLLTEKLKEKEFNGIPLTQELVNKVFDFLYTKKYKTADGQLLTDYDKAQLESKRPEKINERVMFALLKLTNFDFSKIAKRAVSKESNELFTTLAQRKAKKAEPLQKKDVAASSRNWLDL